MNLLWTYVKEAEPSTNVYNHIRTQEHWLSMMSYLLYSVVLSVAIFKNSEMWNTSQNRRQEQHQEGPDRASFLFGSGKIFQKCHRLWFEDMWTWMEVGKWGDAGLEQSWASRSSRECNPERSRRPSYKTQGRTIKTFIRRHVFVKVGHPRRVSR